MTVAPGRGGSLRNPHRGRQARGHQFIVLRSKDWNNTRMHIPCIKCGKPADLTQTKPDRSRVFKCRNKECGEVFEQPPFEPPPRR